MRRMNSLLSKSDLAPSHQSEVKSGQRFPFGKNWGRFLAVLTEDRISQAMESLTRFLGMDTLSGKSFLDVGSGSGLFSLAARRLGATQVHSFDYDPQSVACTLELRRRYYPDDPTWTVERGSALDREQYLAGLGTFDIVYSWGVLHHTGAMWQALANMAPLVKPGGLLYIALYNDQGAWSRRWLFLKRLYNRLPRPLQLPFALSVLLPREARKAFISSAKLRPWVYIRSWTDYSRKRGMSRWHDFIDWLGGYPFEVATPEAIFRFYRDMGFVLENLSTVGGGHANNQYLFRAFGRNEKSALFSGDFAISSERS
jgi:SAM-dependent methyltransferase